MTNDAQKYEKIFSGTKEVAENLKIATASLQPWIDAHVPDAGSIKSIEQFRGGQSNPTYKIITDNKNLVLRRKPPGKLLPSAHAVDRNIRLLLRYMKLMFLFLKHMAYAKMKKLQAQHFL